MHATRSVVAALLGAALMASGVQAAQPEPTQPAQPVVVTVEGGGFQWEAAGLGAAAGVAATLLVLALIFTVRQTGQAGSRQPGNLADTPTALDIAPGRKTDVDVRTGPERERS